MTLNPWMIRLKERREWKERLEKEKEEEQEKKAKIRRAEEAKHNEWFASLSQEEQGVYLDKQRQARERDRSNVLGMFVALASMNPGHR